MKPIGAIYKMLNWENPPEVREEGRRLARELEDLSILIMPPAAPSVWEACAEILSEKSDDVLVPYLGEILDWLYDLNWPGALTILERLRTFSGEKLKQPFLDSLDAVADMKSWEGDRWRFFLSELLDNEELKTKLPQEIAEALQKHRRDWLQL